MTVKKSNSEGGHAKNVANFEDVLVRCIGLSTVYNPSSPELQIGNLQQLLSEGRMALDRLIDALGAAGSDPLGSVHAFTEVTSWPLSR